ncbi:serine hydrolase [Sphingomonas ginkgonis]|uniref:Beta-lactamase n=1 Tax=Sphingomonas ginkgonis TaxID=2315330 RepID=A0A3R9Z507_9SPHN|nr:serine hydrolase [Sphingomonas ginkgonis]RST29937.1 serine hydrolase [Sphingomonas ginkgonis]
MRRFLLALAAAGLVAPPVAAQSPAPVATPADLQAQLRALAVAQPGGAGIAAIDLATGREISVDGDRPFPLASTVKLLVAATYLDAVDQGRRSLAEPIPFDERWRHHDGLMTVLAHPGVTLSAANWIEAMLTQSDNSAADQMFAAVGGPAAVQRWATAHGVAGVRVDRDIGGILLDNIGLPRLAGRSDAEALVAADALPALAPAQMDSAAARFAADPRDQGSALGMARLLARIDRGELLRPASRAWLLDVLGRTRTGPDRIAAGLPAGARLAHKTGSLRGVTDDVGIATLPGGRRIAIAVLASGPASDGKARAALIAAAARAIAAAPGW